MRQDDAGIGDEATPVAGMVRALAQIDDKVDHGAAARAEKDRRPVGRDARAVRRDQQVRPQQLILVPQAKLAQPGRADLLAHLDQDLHVEAQGRARAAALGEHSRERRDVDAVLSLVIGGAAAVDARALDAHHPGGKAAAPLLVEAADGVAVPVDQHGEQRRVLDALSHQEGRARGVVEHA
jgi:hypothetical protein